MKTISELSNAAVVIHTNDWQPPFIIQTERFCTITGNVFGNYSFQVMNSDEVYMHIANPDIIPAERNRKIRVICRGENVSLNSTIELPTNAYVIPKSRFQAEKINGAFSSPKKWGELKIKLDMEASEKAAKHDSLHPKLDIIGRL